MIKSKTKTGTVANTENQVLSYDIVLGDCVKVTEDKRTKTRIANFPFEFPDGTRGIVIVCRVKDKPWIPSKDITSININFHVESNATQN